MESLDFNKKTPKTNIFGIRNCSTPSPKISYKKKFEENTNLKKIGAKKIKPDLQQIRPKYGDNCRGMYVVPTESQGSFEYPGRSQPEINLRGSNDGKNIYNAFSVN